MLPVRGSHGLHRAFQAPQLGRAAGRARRLHPNTYYSSNDLEPFAETGQLAAVLSCGMELGHLERYRKHYKLTAQGMMYAESQGWTEE